MKPETKLWIKKRLLMTLRAIVWHLDEWVHAQEVKLREEIELREGSTRTPDSKPIRLVKSRLQSAESMGADDEEKSAAELSTRGRAPRRRHGITASAFDLRFSSR